MANHCVDVVCLDCGCNFCCRCGDVYFTKDKEELKEYMERNDKMKSDVRCPSCKKINIVWDHK